MRLPPMKLPAVKLPEPLASIRVPMRLRGWMSAVGARLAVLRGSRERWGRGAGYAAFFVVALLLFTVARFPAGSLTPLVREQIAAAGLPVTVTVREAGPSFPLGLRLSGIGVTDPGFGGQKLIDVDRLDLNLSWLSLMTFTLGADADAELLDGEVSATAAGSGWPMEPASLSFSADHLELGLIPFWAEFPWAKVRGRLSGGGEVDLSGGGDPMAGSGSFSLDLIGAEATLGASLFPGLPPITFDDGMVEGEYEDGKVTLAKLSLSGERLALEGEGTVMLAQVPRYSRLNLKVRLRLGGDLKEKLSPFLMGFADAGEGWKTLSITGTLAAPTVK